jgi:endonuclease-8
VETFRVPDRARHPHSGGVGPDISQRRPNLVEITRRLLSYKAGETSICDVLADQSVITGLGNADRSETLWAVGLSPFAPVVELSYEDCAVLVEAAARIVKSRTREDGGYEHSVYSRNGQRCPRCRGTVSHGYCEERSRTLYWCPDCQQKLDRRLIPAQLVADDHTPTHPAEILYMADVRAARKRLKIDDELTRFG